MWKCQGVGIQTLLDRLVQTEALISIRGNRYQVELHKPYGFLCNCELSGESSYHYSETFDWAHIMGIVSRDRINIEHCEGELENIYAHRANVLCYLAQHCDATLLEAVDVASVLKR